MGSDRGGDLARLRDRLWFVPRVNFEQYLVRSSAKYQYIQYAVT